jgi:hypothetical protein
MCLQCELCIGLIKNALFAVLCNLSRNSYAFVSDRRAYLTVIYTSQLESTFCHSFILKYTVALLAEAVGLH